MLWLLHHEETISYQNQPSFYPPGRREGKRRKNKTETERGKEKERERWRKKDSENKNERLKRKRLVYHFPIALQFLCTALLISRVNFLNGMLFAVMGTFEQKLDMRGLP